MKVEFEARVLGGFPVLVRCIIDAPDRSVGECGPQVTVDEVVTLNGGSAEFVTRRMSRDDWENLARAALEVEH